MTCVRLSRALQRSAAGRQSLHCAVRQFYCRRALIERPRQPKGPAKPPINGA